MACLVADGEVAAAVVAGTGEEAVKARAAAERTNAASFA